VPTYPVVLQPFTRGKSKGRVLLSYLEQYLDLPVRAPQFLGHTNFWESRAIARIFQKQGYQVEAISWMDLSFAPDGKYDVVFDLFANLARLSPLLEKDTVRLLRLTGSDPFYATAAETRRVAEVNQRRNGNCQPKRALAGPEWKYASLDAAHACTLIGNEHTRRTWPEKYWHKMDLVTVSGAEIGRQASVLRRRVPPKREFLWFFGAGAIHKGLDLLLEVFAAHPELQLHVVGNVAAEEDFFELYRKELTATPNIHLHGYLHPSGPEVRMLLQHVFCFVAPSCSESISTAVAACLQLGLFPIISRDTGITLPQGCGMYIERLATAEIEMLVLAAMGMTDEEIIHQTLQTQE
jgi:glycosyltransferase involved in cell wall biosynthesis